MQSFSSPVAEVRSTAAAALAFAARGAQMRRLQRGASLLTWFKASHLKKKFLSFARVYQKKNGC